MKQAILGKISNLESELAKAKKELDKNWDEEYERLRRVERDYSPHDGETTYYIMIKIKDRSENNWGNYWGFESSDGMARTSGGAKTAEEAFQEAIAEAKYNFRQNVDREWKLNAE